MAEARKPDSRGLNFFDVTDFSPGIYDSSLVVRSEATTPLVSPGIFPAPPGAADGNFTFGCMSLPTGGLGPLPKLTATKKPSDFGINSDSGVASILAFQNSFVSNYDEIVIGWGYYTTLPNVTAQLVSALWFTGSHNAIFSATWDPTATANAINTPQMPYAFSTRCTDTAGFEPATDVGQAVIVIPVMGNNSILLYPDPGAPTAYGTYDLLNAGANGVAGPTFGHQNRVITLESENREWPVTSASLNNTFYELLSYTEPPNSESWPRQQEVFGPENPYGYGGVGSVSAGELFMVKQRGGAIIVQGDINNPTVTSLPGVKSTGEFYGEVGAGAGGMYYCSEQQGAHVWNGGNTSQKISAQLDDDFFSADATGFAFPLPTYGYYCQRWGEWMMFSNSWIYNMDTQGWWRLCDPSVFSWYFYTPGYFGAGMYTSLLASAVGDPCFGHYDRTIPGASYQWQSLPIKVPVEDRTSTAREVVIRASNPYADAAPIVAVSIIDDKGTVTALDTWTMTTGIDTVQEIRLNAGMKQTNTIAIRLSPSGTLYAPVIHGLSVGYRSREHAALA